MDGNNVQVNDMLPSGKNKRHNAQKHWIVSIIDMVMELHIWTLKILCAKDKS